MFEHSAVWLRTPIRHTQTFQRRLNCWKYTKGYEIGFTGFQSVSITDCTVFLTTNELRRAAVRGWRRHIATDSQVYEWSNRCKIITPAYLRVNAHKWVEYKILKVILSNTHFVNTTRFTICFLLHFYLPSTLNIHTKTFQWISNQCGDTDDTDTDQNSGLILLLTNLLLYPCGRLDGGQKCRKNLKWKCISVDVPLAYDIK